MAVEAIGAYQNNGEQGNIAIIPILICSWPAGPAGLFPPSGSLL